MKSITLIIGAVIIVGGAWILLSPQSADGPANPPTFEEGEAIEKESSGEAMMEKEDSEHGMEDKAVVEDTPMTKEEEPVGDPIFHAVVDYTDEGYTPATVTIKKGETVRFVNNSSRGNWVGGNNHPSHTIYPEKSDTDCLGTSFDTCRTLQAGEFWEFTFMHVGEWGYHNHVRARDGGTIIVTE